MENPVQPVSDLNYYECLDTVTEQSKRLGDGMTGIAHYAKALNMDSFCQSVRDVANAVCGLAEGAAQAAYMVGVSDSNSTPGRSGLIETTKCERSVQFVREVCERINARRYNQQQILDVRNFYNLSLLRRLFGNFFFRTPPPLLSTPQRSPTFVATRRTELRT